MLLVRNVLLVFLLCVPFVLISQINFQEKDYSTCVQTAATNNVPFMVYIHADWCLPCQLMDDGTFSDPNLTNTLGDHLNLYKINYDSDLGLAWRQEFGIACLPTTLMFGIDGTLIDRVESSYSPKECLSLLVSNNMIPNGQLVDAENNDAISVIQHAPKVMSMSVSKMDHIQKSITALEELINSNTLSSQAETELKKSLQLLKHEVTTTNTIDKKEGSLISSVAVSNRSITKTTHQAPLEQYEVQLGVFKIENNATNLSIEINSSTNKKAYIVQQNMNGTNVYRIILGAYDHKKDAIIASNEIQEAGFKSFVKKR